MFPSVLEHPLHDTSQPTPLSQLYHTGASARWRRKQSDYHNNKALTGARTRNMEEVHGVDVSWLHHPNKEQQGRRTPSGNTQETKPTPSADSPSQAAKQPNTPGTALTSRPDRSSAPRIVTPPVVAEPAKDTTTALPSTPTPPPINGGPKAQAKRPSLNPRNSSDKSGGSGGRRTSWISNISSRFGSSTPERPIPVQKQPTKQSPNAASSPSSNGTPSPLPAHQEEEECEPAPYIPSKPKDGSFLSSLTRRLSSGSMSSAPRVQGSGGVCPRRVLNVDPNREKCHVPEMEPSRLRKVSFCVDVEIASGPRYIDEDDSQGPQQQKTNAKLKERAEGEALKRPQALQEEKDERGEVKLDARSRNVDVPRSGDTDGQDDGDDGVGTLLRGSLDDDRENVSRKKEKKKRSEEERKERQEKRKRRAEESGTVPVELKPGDGPDLTVDALQTLESTLHTSPHGGGGTEPSTAALPSPNPSMKQDRPTTDPVRIYRRCCQLRETPILKRITEQLMAPDCCALFEPGVVRCLDLSRSRLQLADVVTLGDWLAVVPVKQLRLEDADINDEGVRHILAGLIAAKKPQPSRRKNVEPRHRERIRRQPCQERSGVVEKITLKNNPRITRLGWKHINLFIYMCRSLRTIDISMNQFPETLPAATQANQVKNPQNAPRGEGRDTDAGETLRKCLSERPGGSRLEELILSECGLTTTQIGHVVGGVEACGISRLGLAGNHLVDEGLTHVMRYLRSGVCQGLDIGGNDLRGKTSVIAEAILHQQHVPCWGLSVAGCNLDTADLKTLFPALVKLPDFRFIDLSHNHDLCTQDNGLISLFRRYMSHFKNLKRLHLADVGMSPKQAIALADCLPDGPRLAHLNLLDNPQLSALANASNETDQEEACALYASLMAAVRVSSTLICIDIDVPSAENSEVVKALAKQVVAYSLRNMEQFAIAEATGTDPKATATAKLTEPHGGEKQVKEITVPDVLMHLVGHVDGSSEHHARHSLAPDDDYIVGGTGVVKALQYVLGEKANDLRRTSVTSTPISGSMTPRERPGSSAGLTTEEYRGKAKKMSKNLLDSARTIRVKLQPALVQQATAGDELAYRRLLFLDQTLQNMIQRFEEEYPETRLAPSSPRQPASVASSRTERSSNPPTDLSLTTQATEATSTVSDDDDPDDDGAFRPGPVKRHNSNISLNGRALSMEEGRLHRLGQHLRRSVIESPTSPDAASSSSATLHSADTDDDERLKELGAKLEAISGPQLRTMVENEGWANVLKKVGGNYDDLRRLQEQDPEGYEQFRESQMKARMNLRRDRVVS